MEEIRTNTYGFFKKELDSELQKTSESFVRIGYLLKVARDTEILKESGYRTVAEFAAAEYGMNADTVSRFMAINDRYSVNGYSELLEERYRPYGYAKLAEMLTLPDVVVDAIPQTATRKEIQELKKEIKEEEKVSDLEILAELASLEGKAGDPGEGQQEGSILYRFLEEYYRSNPEEYARIHPESGMGLYDAMAPSGTAAKMARVPGKGRMMMAIKGKDRDPEMLNIRTNEKEPFTWQQVQEEVRKLCGEGTARESWERLYQEPYPGGDTQEVPRKKEKSVSIAKPKPAPKENDGKQPEKKTQGTESGNPEGKGQEPPKGEIAPVQIQEGKGSAEETGKAVEPGAGAGQETETGEKQDMEPAASGSTEETAGPEPPEDGIDDAPGNMPGTPQVDDTIYNLRKEADECIGNIQAAMGKRYYSMAKMEAKKLVSILDTMYRESERKPMPGQHEIEEYLS